MRITLQAVSWLALAATIVPSMIYLGGALELEIMQAIMFGATIAWFAATPLWMQRQP